MKINEAINDYERKQKYKNILLKQKEEHEEMKNKHEYSILEMKQQRSSH